MLRAMLRLVIILLGITWASLLLISWSGSTEIPTDSAPQTHSAS